MARVRLSRRFVPNGVLLVAVLAACAPAIAKDDGKRTVVEDLAYGEVLFHFYQDNHFAALTRLMAAQVRNETPSHAADAELMLGGLYLSYGQHRLAGEIFERVLAQSVDPALHDRAWFFLAKIWHERGYLDEADAALRRIVGILPPELEPDRRMLQAQVMMAQGRFADALSVLERWPEKQARWLGFARFNIGVALVRLGQVEAGTAVLNEVGQIETGGDSELAALRDKANVALGYAWLQANAPAAAKPSLQRVRLTGPFASKALLGVGWADAEQNNYRAALAPWVELRGRNLLDSAVQESLLAVPYAYAQLGADAQAADYYLEAIASFDREIARLDGAIESVEGGQLEASLLATGANDGSGWYWRLDDVPDTIESRYLYELMSTNRFQEALKNYRDVLQLNANLSEWSRSLEAFEDILDTKQRAYQQRLPLVEASLARVDVDALNARRVELASQLASIERNEDVVALVTADEQRQWQRITAMEQQLELLGSDGRAAQLRDKQRFLKGLLVWQLSKAYMERRWRAERALRSLELEIRAADRLELRVRNARDQWPAEFAAQTAKVAGLQTRVAAVRSGAEIVLARQRDYLQGIAVEELLAQRDRLRTYIVQARFSLAAIYDRAAAQGPSSAALQEPAE